MQLELGNKIRFLRRRDARTQEELANALGVTAQAVSRWEMNGAYPDIEIVPAIANYFGITIDELFGYEGERNKKIDEIIDKIDALDYQNFRDDVNLDECVYVLRNGLAEFPGNERLMYRLARILDNAGWHRHRDWTAYGNDGYICYCFDGSKRNEYWSEAIKIFKTLINSSGDTEIVTNSTCSLILLYRNTGEKEKAISLARRLPTADKCREVMLCTATDGREQSEYLGNALLRLAREFTEQFMYALVNKKQNFDSDMPIQKVSGLIDLFNLVCEDGNYGQYHDHVCDLYLYLSRLQWEKGLRDEAFQSLDNALIQARAYDRLAGSDNARFTSSLVSLVKYDFSKGHAGDKAKNLKSDWPMWCNPDYSEVKAEITADPRWQAWVERTENNL